MPEYTARKLWCSTEAVPCTLHLQNMHKICFKSTTRANKGRNAQIRLTHLAQRIPGRPTDCCSKFGRVLAARPGEPLLYSTHRDIASFVNILEVRSCLFPPNESGRKPLVEQRRRQFFTVNITVSVDRWMIRVGHQKSFDITELELLVLPSQCGMQQWSLVSSTS